jgi:hypothetical protein
MRRRERVEVWVVLYTPNRGLGVICPTQNWGEPRAHTSTSMKQEGFGWISPQFGRSIHWNATCIAGTGGPYAHTAPRENQG